MVLVPSLLFLALLAAVQLLDPAMVDRPLSLFRDGRWAAAGYALFGLLLNACGLHVRAYHRQGEWRRMGVPVFSTILLAVVAVTPSYNGVHGLAAFGLLGLVFGHYGWRLTAAGGLLALTAHLLPPLLLSVYVGLYGLTYGVWQKGLILYFLLALNLDHLLLTGRLRVPGPDDFARPKRRAKTREYRPRVRWTRYDGRGRMAGST